MKIFRDINQTIEKIKVRHKLEKPLRKRKRR